MDCKLERLVCFYDEVKAALEASPEFDSFECHYGPALGECTNGDCLPCRIKRALDKYKAKGINEQQKVKTAKLTPDDEGDVSFRILPNGKLRIEIFRQDMMTDIVDIEDRNELAKWLIDNIID